LCLRALSHTLSTVMAKLLALGCLIASAAATELTPDNWESATAGKTVFVKFQAPW